MPDPGREIGAANIKVSAEGVKDTQAELERLRAEIRKLSDELLVLKQAADSVSGTESADAGNAGGVGPGGGGAMSGGGGSRGGGLGGLGSKLKTVFGIITGAGIAKEFLETVAAIGMVNAELDKYSAKLTAIRGDAAKATGDTVTGIHENAMAAMGLPTQFARSPGPNARALGAATSGAIGKAADELQDARDQFNRMEYDAFKALISLRLPTFFSMKSERTGRLIEAEENYQQTLAQQSNLLVRNMQVARDVDSLEMVNQLRAIRAGQRR